MRARDMMKSTCSFLNTSRQTKSRKLVIISVIRPSSGPFSKDIYTLVFNVKTVYIVDLATVKWECGTETINCIFNLIFVCPCMINAFTKYNQRDATFLNLFSSQDALHVSGGSSAHHQKHKTVHTASAICQTNGANCCYHGRSLLSYDVKY